MKDRPILFSGPMVRALLAGTKTQTRRVVKPQPQMVTDKSIVPWEGNAASLAVLLEQSGSPCPYGQPGDRIWVRENGWERPERTPKMMREGADTWEPYYYDADDLPWQDVEDFKQWGFKRRPSIHMPRWASRITLEITGVRVERLQDISEADAIAEGIERGESFPGWYRGPLPGDGAGLEQAGRDFKIPTAFPKLAYRALWDSINGPGSWDANPWVWVVEFRRVTA